MPAISSAPALVLASSSRFRRELLERLGLPFECISPDVDESARPGETAGALAARLAQSKAEAVLAVRPDAVVIGSDQVGERAGEHLGKPGTPAANVEQLLRSAGQSVVFHTGLSVMDATRTEVDVVEFRVDFRDFDRPEAERYVQAEPAHDCAGGFRSEARGIALFERMRGDDPTALVGLPLIRLCQALRGFGLDPLA